MKIRLKSKVTCELETVHSRFDGELFKYLLPPGAQLIEFGGSTKGDIVHLKLPLAVEWVSEITENGKSEDSYYFIDEGRKLPFPLKKWKLGRRNTKAGGILFLPVTITGLKIYLKRLTVSHFLKWTNDLLNI